LDYWVSYSFLDTERDYLNFPVAAAPSFASRHNASFVSKYFVTPIRTQVGLTYSFASGRPYTDPNTRGFQNQMTPSYHDLSVNFSYLIKPHIILHGSVSNVLGFNNIFGYEYASEPNQEGVYEERAIELPAPRFAFMGLFITLSKNNQVNQLPNL
jgi:outer membrane cobalamin receptor